MSVKNAIVGGTINLGNYENFRFEFSGACESADDYLDLAAFAAASLLAQGARSDKQTEEKFRMFVGQVFGLPDEKVPVLKVAPKEEQVEPAAPKPATKPEKKKEVDTSHVTKTCTAYSCDECGTDVSATQKRMTQLFVGKTLCKDCMEKMREGQA